MMMYEKKLANHEIDCFVSLEESLWSEQGISSVTTIGKSGIYLSINKEAQRYQDGTGLCDAPAGTG